MDIHDRWERIWAWVEGSPAERVQSTRIPEHQVSNSGTVAMTIEPGNHYFAVFVNELFLTHARRWTAAIDPMVLVVCEFTYNKEKKIVPFVVGPSLLAGKTEKVPHGMVFTDTQVAGVCPYPGGTLAITVILCEVSAEPFPRKMLNVIEKAASSFSFGSALSSHLKIAEVIMDGVEGLLALNGVRPLIGHRWEYNDGFTPWLRPGFFALITGLDGRENFSALRVGGGRLCLQDGARLAPYRNADYVLYSLHLVEKRTDYTELPFYLTFETALKAASSSDDGAWQRAKAALLTAYQEMITSPDLTWQQAQELSEAFQEKLLTVKKRADSFGTLSANTSGAPMQLSIPATIAGLPHASERVARLLQVHKVLDL